MYMKWSTAQARDNLSQVVEASESEPQVILNRGRPVAVVIGFDDYEAFMEWKRRHPTQDMSEALDELRAICADANYSLDLPDRADRANPIVAAIDELSG